MSLSQQWPERSSGRRWTMAKEIAREIVSEEGERWPERLPEKEDSDSQRSRWGRRRSRVGEVAGNGKDRSRV
ncbi:hypothetical protein LguiA_013350 [Lonicera macranthoides]